MKDEKVSYSVIAGELRKGARLYEVFKHASEAADILGDFERQAKTAEKNIERLTKEESILKESCQDAYDKQKEAENSVIIAHQKADGTMANARAESDKIMAKAQVGATKFLDEAKDELQGIKDSINTYGVEAQVADNKRKDAVDALAKVTKQVEATKAKFLKTLG